MKLPLNGGIGMGANSLGNELEILLDEISSDTSLVMLLEDI